MNRTLICGRACVAVVLLAAWPARAQAPDPVAEFTPFAGYRAGGRFDFNEAVVTPPSTGTQPVDLDSDASFGLDVGVYRDSTSFYELLYSRQQAAMNSSATALRGAKMRVEYYQFGGTVLYPNDDRRAVPYLSLTIGATRFSADGGGSGSGTDFSASLGGGVRVPLGTNVIATAGLRGYATFTHADAQFLCVSGSAGATCLLKSTGSVFFQGEAQLGLTFRF